jgi:hypothetical protein
MVEQSRETPAAHKSGILTVATKLLRIGAFYCPNDCRAVCVNCARTVLRGAGSNW